MPQSADKILDHELLFREPEYQELFKNKKEQFEYNHSDEKIGQVIEWTKTEDYKQKNFARDSLTVNPAKACQPLGAVYVANGFHKTLSFVHGSQGCVAYYRSHFSRHFKEPTSCVSSSMTEDAAVFGGLNNMVDGLANAYNLYKPDMIAVSTTCMAEVIGDDLNAFIKTSKEKGSVPAEFDVPFAHTPAFGVKVNVLCDPSGSWSTPTDGEFRMYEGGTTKEEVIAGLHAKATIVFQEYCCEKTSKYIAEKGQEVVVLNAPVGVAGTDEFLMAISRLTGKPIPAELELERGLLVDAMADSQAHLHGKRYALYGDPDQMIGYAQFLLELGAEPAHVLATNGTETWAAKVQALFDSSPYGAGCKVYPKRDLWHMRSLLFTEPVDFLIGNTYGKYLERDTGTPLVRMVFPIFDRHHYHRFPTWGYEGGMRVLVNLLDEFFETLDANTIVPGKTDYSYDIIR